MSKKPEYKWCLEEAPVDHRCPWCQTNEEVSATLHWEIDGKEVEEFGGATTMFIPGFRKNRETGAWEAQIYPEQTPVWVEIVNVLFQMGKIDCSGLLGVETIHGLQKMGLNIPRPPGGFRATKDIAADDDLSDQNTEAVWKEEEV